VRKGVSRHGPRARWHANEYRPPTRAFGGSRWAPVLHRAVRSHRPRADAPQRRSVGLRSIQIGSPDTFGIADSHRTFGRVQ